MIDMALLYFIAAEIAIIILAMLIFFYSDRDKNFKLISICCLLPTAILEYPHLYLPDPTNLIDLGVHVAAGLTIFIVVMNIKFLPEGRRKILGMLAVIIFIVALEVFQIVLKLTTGLGGEIIILDTLEDIFVTIGGGLLGLIVTILYQKYSKEHVSTEKILE